MKIVFAEDVATADRDFSREVEFLPKGAQRAVAIHDPENMSAFYEEIKDADAIISSFVPFGEKEIDLMEKCKVISIRATGYNAVDIDYAREKGIAVCAVQEYCTQEVADHTLALILALERGIVQYDDMVQIKKEWEPLDVKGLKRIEGKTLGIVGLGKIGQAVAKRAIAFGYNLVAYDPYLPAEVAENLGIALIDIEELLGVSDVITVHMSLTSETDAFFNMDKFKVMKKQPYLINVARGAMVNESDLARALDAGLLKGAGIDVLVDEYPDLHTHCLLGRPNVILTPHAAYYSETSDYMAMKISAENATKCLEGNHKEAKGVVNGVGL